MYIMCALALFLFSLTTMASAKSVTLSGGSSAYSPKEFAITPEEKLRNNIKDVSISVNSIILTSWWKATVAYSKNYADYSQYKIYSFLGAESEIGQDLGEDNLSIDHIFAHNKSTYEIITASNFGTTPLSKSNFSFLYYYKIDQENLFGFSIGYQSQNAPTNYFNNPNNNGTREERPTKLVTQSLLLNYEKIYSAKYKNRLEIMFAERKSDRPLRYGLNLKNVLVVSDDMGFRFDLGYLAEATTSQLKTDLGYQSSYWAETKIIHNFNPYLVYGLGYGIEVNREVKPWLDQTTQLANDQLLADVKYDTTAYTLGLAVAFAKYNTGQEGTNIKGEIEWKF